MGITNTNALGVVSKETVKEMIPISVILFLGGNKINVYKPNKEKNNATISILPLCASCKNIVSKQKADIEIIIINCFIFIVLSILYKRITTKIEKEKFTILNIKIENPKIEVTIDVIKKYIGP